MAARLEPDRRRVREGRALSVVRVRSPEEALEGCAGSDDTGVAGVDASSEGYSSGYRGANSFSSLGSRECYLEFDSGGRLLGGR